MKKTKVIAVIIALLLTASIFSQVPAAAFGDVIDFPDVDSGEWYSKYVDTLTYLEIINGKDDGLFHPNDTVTRGEFIKMIMCATEGLCMTSNDKSIHWAQPYWTALNDSGVLEMIETDENMAQRAFPFISLDTKQLDKPISRYEMAFLINNLVYLVGYEKKMGLAVSDDSYANYIKDYGSLDMSYRAAVEQVYSKGVLTGYDDTSFKGDNNLKRSEAAAVIYRYLIHKDRKVQSFAVEQEREEIEDSSFVSFANRYHSMSTTERRIALFGNANKSYFTSAADAGSYIVPVVVKTWDINSSGNKYTRTWKLYVNKVVAKEVQLLFNDIYNDPEKFPIHALGGARYTDTLRHSWGCAIDINPVENYYVSYRTGQQVGTCCYKNVSQHPNINSNYCITPNGSVVRAFAKYGWGWGGQGWTSGVDYMHFSILASGG